MDTEYRRWLDERKHRETMAHGIHTPPPTSPTLATAVAVPLLQATAIGGALGLLGGGLGALFGAPLLLAGKLALAGMVTGTAGSTILFIIQERTVHTTPARLAWERLHLAEPSAPPEPEPEPWRVIRPYVAKAPPMVTATATRMEHAAAPVEPSARPEIRALHDFICANWGRNGTGNLSRDACRKRGFTRSVWERYVGGRRGKAGAESAKGTLHRAGVAEKTAGGWQWKTGCSLGDVFNVQAELAEYADARAKMGIGNRDRTGRTGQDAHGGPSEPSQAQKG